MPWAKVAHRGVPAAVLPGEAIFVPPPQKVAPGAALEILCFHYAGLVFHFVLLYPILHTEIVPLQLSKFLAFR